MNRLRLFAMSWAVLLAACGGKSKTPPPPVANAPSNAPDAGLDPATAAARAAEDARRAALIDKCRGAVWTRKSPGIAVANCDVAYKEDPRASVKTLLSQAKQMLTSLDAEEKHSAESKQADAALTKKDGVAAYHLLRSCCSSDKARLAKATAEAEKQCIKQVTAGSHDVAACYVWFDSVCEKLPTSEWQPPAGKRFKAIGPLTKTDWRPKDTKIDALLRTQAQAGGAANLNCQPQPVTQVLADSELDPKTWFESWYDGPDAREALISYYDGGVSKATESVTTEPALAAQLAKLSQLNQTVINARRPVDQLAPLEQALALDVKVVMADIDAGFPVPQSLLQGGHRARLLEQYASAALAAGKEAQAKGDAKEACRLYLAGQQKLATPEINQALAACAGH
ncbi:MAG: hypothetical protein QM723_37265 [Myxococcaceae bacterium]